MLNKPVFFFIKYWVPVLSWAGVIFYFSSLSGPLLPECPNSDKFLHIIEYSILAYLVSRLFKYSGYAFSDKRYLVFVLALLVVWLYGATDEWHQYFVAGRNCSWWDFLADGIGATIGAYIYS